MKKNLRAINAIAMVAFYIGAACFLSEGKSTPGILAIFAGTCSLITFILNGKNTRSE